MTRGLTPPDIHDGTIVTESTLRRLPEVLRKSIGCCLPRRCVPQWEAA
jgi:hypothetical protein